MSFSVVWAAAAGLECPFVPREASCLVRILSRWTSTKLSLGRR